MPLEEQIVDWSRTRPAWQRMLLRDIAAGKTVSMLDYDPIVDSLVAGNEIGDGTFGLQHLPSVNTGDPPVRLVSISDTEHVNALESDKPLTFDEVGLNIVYGDNASGKSGYARLLKPIARARHQEEILSDVFRDTSLARPKALLRVKIGDVEKLIAWTEVKPPELKRMLFYDQACGVAYIAIESDFPYRPSILFVMDGLIQSCVAIRERIDARLEENSLSAKPLPAVDDELRNTGIGRFLSQISAGSSIVDLNAILTKTTFSPSAVEELKIEEARLRAADTTSERQRLTRHVVKLEVLKFHLEAVRNTLGSASVRLLQDQRNKVSSLEEAAKVLTKTFQSEPISGVGSAAWKPLWESARRFSEADAYPTHRFPFIAGDVRCVLCQQQLATDAKHRLTRFEQFVQDDTQKLLREASANWANQVTALTSFSATPHEIETHLKDLEPEEGIIVHGVRDLLSQYETLRKGVLNLLTSTQEIPLPEVDITSVVSRLESRAGEARRVASTMSNPEEVKRRLKMITTERKELELLREISDRKQIVADEIQRLKKRDLLEEIKNSAATGPITKKVLELSEENITEVVRDTFTRETDRLQLERVTIAKTRADRGALLHLPKLVGARQNSTLKLVFSEGERTALGLAAFFTEAQLDVSKSALILDDPVTSLDHIRRALVAGRIAALAMTRQVVVFTHDVSFVADLKREAKGLGVAVCERSVLRGRGTDKKPGRCSTNHPWKARDVTERLGDLRNELARLKRESSDWDQDIYEKEVASWAGNLSETWERIFSQELVGQILSEGGIEVRPTMTKILVRFTDEDDREFQASYSRVSQWAKRHDKSGITNYVAPTVGVLEEELGRVDRWFKRVRAYKNS